MPDPEHREEYNAWVEKIRHEDIEREKENYSVRESGIEGKGWFANHDFAPEELISHYLVGRYEDIKPESAIEAGSDFDTSCVQCGISADGEALYVGVPDNPRRYVNHSCEPNAGIRRSPRSEGGWDSNLIAIKVIQKGNEITIDYSVTQFDDWSMECRCGSPTCRHNVTDIKHLDRALQEKYDKFDLIPDWMKKAMEKGQ